MIVFLSRNKKHVCIDNQKKASVVKSILKELMADFTAVVFLPFYEDFTYLFRVKFKVHSELKGKV